MATIKDVARMAGVSVSTVSRVINESGYSSPETRQKVLQCMQELGFSPNDVARGLVSGRTASIGLLIPDVSNPFFADIARGAEDAAIAQGYSLILCNSDWKMERERMYLDTLRSKRVEGVVVAGSRSEEDTLKKAIGTLPFVMVDRRAKKIGASVWIDNTQGAMAATEHLIDIGCKRIAHITGPELSPSSTARLEGFKRVVKQANVDYRIIEGDFRYAGGYEAGRQLFIGGSAPDGIFAANDLMAIAVIQVAQSLGIRVPEDVVVVGYDNIAMAEYVSPKLTTVEQPGYQMGTSGFELLYEQLVHPDTKVSDIEFTPRMILRESTRRD
ncbi:LacI family DNA-binding transcriptional regulator [Alicyclobacillus curvatus]|nr:LacI family DNA-binding transcriptional regulator [Alicyclobacillus curvatus]